ncbi:MAG TPA: Rieske 2Fe-2S domain-containing protein [Actinomycetota bacterium]|nr:Rieske 2Fe-2S domain-containing protein [Actinomycetota bacterium]
MGEPVTLCPADAVADLEMKAFAVGPDHIAVARIGGELYAFDDTCTHAACSLAEGELEGVTVVCPCHMGQYDLKTGEVLDGPPPDPIKVYPVYEDDGKLMVELD